MLRAKLLRRHTELYDGLIQQIIGEHNEDTYKKAVDFFKRNNSVDHFSNEVPTCLVVTSKCKF